MIREKHNKQPFFNVVCQRVSFHFAFNLIYFYFFQQLLPMLDIKISHLFH